MKLAKKILSMALILSIPLSLCSCYDLGNYTNDEDYLNSFDVWTIDSDKDTDSYELEEFYNDEAINNYECPIDFDEYKYFSFEAQKDMTIGDVCFYYEIDADKETDVELELYKVDKLPDKFYDLESDITAIAQFIEDRRDDPSIELEVSEGNEPCEGYLAKKTVSVKANKWDSTRFSSYYVDTSGASIYDSTSKTSSSFEIKEGEFILIKICNNAGTKFDTETRNKYYTSYSAMLKAAKAKLNNQVSIKFTAVIIEAE